jgi:alpha-amylase
MKFFKFFKIPLLAFVLFTSCRATKNNSEKTNPSYQNWYSNSNIYEVNLRQYTKEGTINAFAKHLSRLKDMGVEILWFMPITPIGMEGRKMTEKELGSYYAVRNYSAFNEEYGTMNDWKAFVKQAHSMGFKVITDWVANHSAPDNPWLKSHPQFYEKDAAGNFAWSFDWSDTRNLNYANSELRDSMMAAMKFWLTETHIDGFRCDMAGEVPTDFWKDCINELKKVNPAVFMLAEGEKPELITAGFNVNYTWTVMHAMKDLYTGNKTLAQFDSVINAGIQSHPADAARLFFTSNHDENSWNGTEFEKFGNAYKAFAVLSQTMAQSIPLIYSGQEMPNKKRLKFFVKDPIEWNGKFELASFYKTLLTLRKNNPALSSDARYQRLASSNDNVVYAYAREKQGRKLLVIFNMSNTVQKFKINNALINGQPFNVFMAMPEKISTTHEFSVEPWGYIVYDYK